MKWHLEILIWFKRALTSPGAELTRWQRSARFAWDLGRHCSAELRHDKATQMAAALTYHTLFSLLPTIVLALVALNAFVGVDDRQQFKDVAIDWVVDALQDDPAAGASDTLTSEKRQEFESVRQRLDEQLQLALNRLEQINFGSIGVVGVLVFLYAATALLTTIERSFSAIFGVTAGRPWYIRLPMYYTVITLSPIMLILAQLLQTKLLGLITEGAWTGWLARPTAMVGPLLAMWLILFLMYILMPNTTVSKRAAIIGSLVAAVGWVISKECFRLYVSNANIVTSLYGALALLPLFLLWLWINWLIVLFGLELTYTLGAMKGKRFKHEAHKQQMDQLVDPMWVLPLAARIAEAFDTGKTHAASDLARLVHMPSRATQKLLDALERANVVHRVQNGQTVAYSLARPAEKIPVEQVLEAAQSLIPDRHEDTERDDAWRFISELRTAARRQAEHKSIADLCRHHNKIAGDAQDASK